MIPETKSVINAATNSYPQCYNKKCLSLKYLVRHQLISCYHIEGIQVTHLDVSVAYACPINAQSLLTDVRGSNFTSIDDLSVVSLNMDNIPEGVRFSSGTFNCLWVGSFVPAEKNQFLSMRH